MSETATSEVSKLPDDYPGKTATFGPEVDKLVYGIFGVQSKDSEKSKRYAAELRRLLTEGVYAEHRDRYGPPVNPGARRAGLALRQAVAASRPRRGCVSPRSARTPAARSGCRAPPMASPASSRPGAGVSRHGVFELAATLDHIGPIARSAVDAGLLLGVLAGADPLDPTASQRPVPDFAEAARRSAQRPSHRFLAAEMGERQGRRKRRSPRSTPRST